jgi:hypothetical protein
MVEGLWPQLKPLVEGVITDRLIEFTRVVQEEMDKAGPALSPERQRYLETLEKDLRDTWQKGLFNEAGVLRNRIEIVLGLRESKK